MKTLFACLLTMCCSAGMLCAQPSDDFYKGLTKTSAPASFQARDFVKQAAKNFAAKRARDFASEYLQYRAVEMDGKYCEFNAYKGYYAELNFDQSTKEYPWGRLDASLYVIPETVMRSDPFGVGTDVLSRPSASIDMATSATLGGIKDRTALEYYNDPNSRSLYLAKTALEIYSPLSANLADCYSYSVNGFFVNSAKESVVSISFETKPETFPSKTRLLGKGTILYNMSTKLPEKVHMANHVDYYSTFYNGSSYSGHTATKHSLELEFSQNDGFLYPAMLSLSVEWLDPQADNDRNVYYIMSNSRLRPFRYHLKEYHRCEFTRPVSVNKTQIADIKKLVASEAVRGLLLYSAPYLPEIWDKVSFTGLNRNKMENDLNRQGESLTVQAERNALSWYEEYSKNRDVAPERQEAEAKRVVFSKAYYQNVPSVRNVLYNKK
jgi:hypothetical protein